MSRYLLYAILFIAAILSGCQKKRDFSPANHVSPAEQDTLISKIVRYAAKVPPMASLETRFNSEFNEYYKAVATEYDIRKYFVGKDSVHYLIVTRAARSIKPMRESIGIKIKYSRDGSFEMYEEVFRTWKMPEEIMEQRYPELFEWMVDGKDLSPFYPKNKGDQYIEFPDGRFYFDLEQRKWVDHLMDSLNAKPRG